LITYGRNVFLHELGYQECPKCYSFKGGKEYTSGQIMEMLQVSNKQEITKRFLTPLSECEFSFNSILDDLQVDPWPLAPLERHQRANGAALRIATTLLEAGTPFSKMLYFIGGPCTVGPGQVVGLKYEETIRSYLDIQKENENTKYLQKAKKFYTELTQRAIKANLAIDIFAFTTD
jgi:protein transport protein SEC23